MHGRAGQSGFVSEQFAQVAGFGRAERGAYYSGRAIETFEPQAPVSWPMAVCLIAGETRWEFWVNVSIRPSI
jgi:hypothetical protein